MTMKNKQMLKGIICNFLLFLTLVGGNASEINKEDLDKARPYRFSPKYKEIARKYGRDYDTSRAPSASGSLSLSRSTQEFRGKTHELLESIQKKNEQQNKIGKAIVGAIVAGVEEQIEEKVEDTDLRNSIASVLDIMAESLNNFFFSEPKEK